MAEYMSEYPCPKCGWPLGSDWCRKAHEMERLLAEMKGRRGYKLATPETTRKVKRDG